MEKDVPLTEFRVDYLFREGDVGVQLEGLEVLRVFFYADNFSKAIFRKLNSLDPAFVIPEEERDRVYEELRRLFAEQDRVMSLEQIRYMTSEALRWKELKNIKESIGPPTERLSGNLLNIVKMVWERVFQATGFAGANEFREIMEQPDQKYTAKEIHKEIFREDWERLKPLLGVAHGGKRTRKAEKFAWDKQTASAFYQTVEALPRHGAEKMPMWEYARDVLRDNDYDYETIRFLMGRTMFADVPEDLLKEAAKIWRRYGEKWETLPPANSPQAYAFRHACHKLGYPEYAYNTLRTRYYEGKKASEIRE